MTLSPCIRGILQEEGGFSSWRESYSCYTICWGERGMKCCSVPVACPECTAAWWLWSPGLHCGPSDVGTPLLQTHSQWCSDSTFLPTSLISCTQRELFCRPATVDHLWSRKHSKLLCHPVGYDHNLCKEVKLQPWRWALSEFVLPSVHFLSLRYALDFSLHLYNYSYQSFGSVQFSRSVVSDSLRPHGLQHTRPPCQSSTPGVY